MPYMIARAFGLSCILQGLALLTLSKDKNMDN